MKTIDIRSSFNQMARSYNQHNALQKIIAHRLLERLDYITLSPKTILDLGAGTGNVCQDLKKKYKTCHLIALDCALQMLQQANKKRSFFSSFQCLCAEADNLPLIDASMDLIFSNLTFQWITDYPKLFKEIKRVIRPNGLLIFSSLGPQTLIELRNAWKTIDDEQHINHFTDLHDLGDAMLKAGFIDPVVDMEIITMTYTNFKTILEDTKSISLQNMSSTPPLTTQATYDKLQENYQQFVKNGVYPVTYEIVYGLAWGASSSVDVSFS